jgi:hypothetical protein
VCASLDSPLSISVEPHCGQRMAAVDGGTRGIQSGSTRKLRSALRSSLRVRVGGGRDSSLYACVAIVLAGVVWVSRRDAIGCAKERMRRCETHLWTARITPSSR